jgi:hypothetical protein
MAEKEMSDYCKAYLLKDLRAYPGWSEKPENARKEKKDVDGKEVEVQLGLDDESIVYVHDSYIVTHDIYKNENLLFDNVTDEWKAFLHELPEPLRFEIPVYEPIVIPQAEPAAADSSSTPAAS